MNIRLLYSNTFRKLYTEMFNCILKLGEKNIMLVTKARIPVAATSNALLGNFGIHSHTIHAM